MRLRSFSVSQLWLGFGLPGQMSSTFEGFATVSYICQVRAPRHAATCTYARCWLSFGCGSFFDVGRRSVPSHVPTRTRSAARCHYRRLLSRRTASATRGQTLLCRPLPLPLLPSQSSHAPNCPTFAGLSSTVPIGSPIFSMQCRPERESSHATLKGLTPRRLGSTTPPWDGLNIFGGEYVYGEEAQPEYVARLQSASVDGGSGANFLPQSACARCSCPHDVPSSWCHAGPASRLDYTWAHEPTALITIARSTFSTGSVSSA